MTSAVNRTDTELLALAALAQCRLLQAMIANQERLSDDMAVAYGESYEPAELRQLEGELRQRGVIE